MKKYLIALAVVVLLIIIAGAVYLKSSNPLVTVPNPLACTEEAKLCPDGVTYVARQGPNCEFAECPVAQVIDETADWKTYKNDEYGFEVGYPGSWKVKEGERGVSFLDEESHKARVPLRVSIFETNSGSAQDWLDTQYPGDPTILSTNTIVVGKTEGIKFVGSALNPTGCDETIVLLKDSKIYEISIGPTACRDRSLPNKILSTFKFTK